MRVIGWRPIGKGSIVGAADIVLGKSLEIHGILVMKSQASGALWCAFPGLPMIGADDRVLRDDRGRVRYSIALKWGDRLSGDRFKHSVLRSIADQYGQEALDIGDVS